jgi:endonuclease/exonuclease/phosphatase family metal-dependent hydrolase
MGERPGLRFVTWNIHGCVGRDGRHDPDRIGSWLRALAPDIAALQEVDSRHGAPIRPDLYRHLRCHVGDHGHPAWSISGIDGQYGQMLASRFPLTDCHVHDISVAGREPRKAIEARVALPRGSIRVVATHLGLRRRERRFQLDRLRTIVLTDPNSPAVLLGDLNDWWAGFGANPLSALFPVRTAHRTFPARFPLLPLDRIMCRGGVCLAASRTVIEAGPASDHLPVLATLVPP